MKYTLAVFRARTQTLLFAKLLKSYQIPISIINMPREINISCGLCVKFLSIYREYAESIIKRRKFDSFAGFFEL